MDLKQYDRVKLIQNFTLQGRTIKTGTIGTVREFLSEITVLIQYDYIEETPLYIGVPIGILVPVTKDELRGTDPSRILPKMYQKGNRFSVLVDSREYMGMIVGIQLETNELNDEFSLDLEGVKQAKLTRYYLDTCGMYVPFGMAEAIEMVKAIENNDFGIQEDFSIDIKGFTFKGINGKLVLPESIEMTDIDKFVSALNKVKILCEEGK